MAKLTDLEEEYQKLHGFTESDMAILKSGDVEKIVPLFLDTDDPEYRSMFAMGVKNMYRLVDNHIYVGKAYKVKSLKDEVLGYQKFHGDENAFVGIAGKYEPVAVTAPRTTMSPFLRVNRPLTSSAAA